MRTSRLRSLLAVTSIHLRVAEAVDLEASKLTDLTDNRLTAQKSDTVPRQEQFGLAANTSLYKGQMVAKDASGNLVKADAATAVTVLGKMAYAVDNSTPPAGQATNSYGLNGLAGQGDGQVDYGVNLWNNDSGANACGVANITQVCYVKDDNTVSLSDNAGAALVAGIICGVGDEKGGGDKQVQVWQGPAAIAVANALLASGAPGNTNVARVTSHRVRAVITSIAAYDDVDGGVITASATGAIGAQDGVTLVAGDLVLLPTDKAQEVEEAGPYVVTNPGATGVKFVLTRPTWYESGATQYAEQSIEVGPEGTAYNNSSWKSLCSTPTFVVDTTDGAFYPKLQTSAASVAMTAGVLGTPITALYVAPHAVVTSEPVTPGGTAGPLRVSTQTSGPPGTSSLVATSSSNTDTATVKFKVVNF